MHNSLAIFERPQVKGLLAVPAGIYLATEVGLFELGGGELKAVPVWRNQPVQQIAAAPNGFLLLTEDDSGQTLYLCDEQWQVLQELPRPQSEKIKCLYSQAEYLLAGTKRGLFRLPLDTGSELVTATWQCLFKDRDGWGEVLWVDSDQPQHIRASIKKLGAEAKPALIETQDAGASWHVDAAEDYQDLILAADDQHVISRWKGVRERHARCGYKKHPLTAAWLSADGWALLDGSKLEYQRAGQAKIAFTHPLLAEAERICPLDQDDFLVAGVQGAYLVKPGQGLVSDLFASIARPAGLGKLKRIFELDHGVRLATATYGTFRSVDGGVTWAPVEAEWAVLDAEHLVRSSDGRWWLGCQRALFVSSDNGRIWHYVKLKLAEMPHYAELRGGLAIVGEQLFIGCKTGLLVTRLDDPEQVSRVDAFGSQTIEALFTDRNAKRLVVGTHARDADQLWRYHPGKQKARPLTALGKVPILESEVGGKGRHLLIATGDRLFRIFWQKHQELATVEEVTPQADTGDYHLAAHPGQPLLVWNETNAWLWREKDSAPRQSVSNWPAGIRHAWFGEQGRSALTTDREALRTVTLIGKEKGKGKAKVKEAAL